MKADILASGIHDAKNRLFEAQTLLAQAERAHGFDLPDARLAIAGAATRLSRTLVAYRLQCGQQPMSIMPVLVAELVEDALVTVRSQFERDGIALEVRAGFAGEWPLDRTLAADVLVNALQNAGRHARTTVAFEAYAESGHLRFLINDDGPGYAGGAAGPLPAARSGLGLFIAGRIAALHVRKGARGGLSLSNGGALGGALFDLVLP